MRLFRKAVFLLISIVLLSNASLYAKDNSKEQIAKQNIVTSFRWIEDGNLMMPELKNTIVVIKKQLEVIKKECILEKKPCATVYGCLNNNLFDNLIKGYEYESNNRPLLNRLFVEAAAGKVDIAKPSHPWLNIQNNLIDCLENEVVSSLTISIGTIKTDLTKPEILVAPVINSTVDLVEGALVQILKTQLNLSGAYRLVHDGSTSRGTSLNNTDFDFEVLFENQEDFDLFSAKINPIVETLIREWRSEGYETFSVDSSRQIKSMKLVTFMLLDKDGIVFRMSITVGKNMRIYADILNAQIAQIKALGGSWEYVSGQIILFKRLVRDVLYGYGQCYGGLYGLRCEQFIVQAASSSDYGKKITGIGSFDKTMRWIYNIGFDQASSTVVPFDIATKQIGIYKYADKYQKIECSSSFWNQLVNASKRYVELNKTTMSEEEFASLGYIRGN